MRTIKNLKLSHINILASVVLFLLAVIGYSQAENSTKQSQELMRAKFLAQPSRVKRTDLTHSAKNVTDGNAKELTAYAVEKRSH